MSRVNWVQKSLTPAWQQSQKLVSVLLLTAVAIAYLPVPVENASAQQNPKSPTQNNRTNRASILSAILKLFQQPKNRLGSRGYICPISPALLEETNVIWSDRPLFFWQGETVQRLEVRPYSLDIPYSSQEVLWSQAVTKGERSVIYTGKGLQPGQKYDWELVVVDPSSPRDSEPRPLRYTFQVMDASRRDAIAAELTALETQLKTAGATAEEIALARAKYFAQRELWSDALQEIYLVKNPSADLTKTAQEISTYLCSF